MTDRQTVSTDDYAKLKAENELMRIELKQSNKKTMLEVLLDDIQGGDVLAGFALGLLISQIADSLVNTIV